MKAAWPEAFSWSSVCSNREGDCWLFWFNPNLVNWNASTITHMQQIVGPAVVCQSRADCSAKAAERSVARWKRNWLPREANPSVLAQCYLLAPWCRVCRRMRTWRFSAHFLCACQCRHGRAALRRWACLVPNTFGSGMRGTCCELLKVREFSLIHSKDGDNFCPHHNPDPVCKCSAASEKLSFCKRIKGHFVSAMSGKQHLKKAAHARQVNWPKWSPDG